MYGGQGQIWKVAGLWEISLKFLDLTPMRGTDFLLSITGWWSRLRVGFSLRGTIRTDS